MSLVDSKSVFASGTVWSGVAVIVGQIGQHFGYAISADEVGTFINDAWQIVTLVGGVLAIYFRIKATKTLSLTPATQGTK